MNAAAVEVPGYAVGDRIGSGGFGDVYRARHEVIGRVAAIKVLHDKYSADPEAVARFVAEARAVNRVSHPGIVEIFDFGQLADGRQYCVMELIEGQTLRELLRERSRLPLADALPILRGIAEAIDAAHAAGIAHRDLKPDNVFVTASGVKVIDFGLAKLTREENAPVTKTGSVFGTPLYMSPEQCRGKAVTTATDAYSFGVLAYQVLTGEPPFGGEALEIALHHVNDAPQPPSKRCSDLDTRVDRAVLALLAKDPAARPASLVAAIDAMTGATIPRRRNRAVVGGVVLVLVLALVAVGSLGWRRSRSPDVQWTTKPAAFTPNGIVFPPPTLSADGASIYYADSGGMWEEEVATGALHRPAGLELTGLRRIDPVGDGRFVIDRIHDGADELELFDPIARATVRLGHGEVPVVSPDGRRLAALRDRQIVVIDLQTRSVKETGVRPHNGESSPNWSPDSRALVWAERGEPTATVHLLQIDEGRERLLPLPLLHDTDQYGAVAFTDLGHLVYCSAEGPSIRIHSLEARDSASDPIVTTLSTATSACVFGPSHDGRRIAVQLLSARAIASELALAPQRLEWRNVAAPSMTPGVGYVVAYAVDGDAIVVESSAAQSLHVAPRLSLRRVARDGTSSPISACAGDGGIVRRGNALEHVQLKAASTGGVVRLRRDGTCAIEETWEVSSINGWSVPTCAVNRCVAVHVEDPHRVSLWRFDPGSRRAAHVTDVGVGTAVRVEAVISPDGRRILVTTNRSPPVLVENDAITAIAFDAPVQCARWLDSEHFVATDFNPYRAFRVGLDGRSEEIWSSSSTWACVTAVSPDGTRIAGTSRTFKQDLLLLERD